VSRSVPRNIDRKGEHLSRCDVCGSMWLRSALRRGRDGLLRCEQDQPGREAVTLAMATAGRAAAISQQFATKAPADGAAADTDSTGATSSSSDYTGPVQRLTIEDAYNGSVPGGF
jgi:hypothetical protein